MRKSLRMMCIGAVAIFSALSFAQTDVTNKVLNPDAEKGMLGWDVTFVDGGQIWNKQTKGEEKAPGYYGFDNWAFENWRNAAAPLTNSSIYQVIKNLPNGTYVFGAYAMATNDSWEPSIEIIEGVSMFANENSVPVATHRVEGMDTEWAHSIKFNVATTVTDGTLKIGMQNENTNANFIAMDNVTLYYFEDMDHAAALEEMAKIDIAATVKKVTPYLEASKMNADTLALLQTAIDAAAEVTAETAAQIDANLYWGKRQAKKSIADYNSLAEAIAVAKEVAAMEWSEFVADDLDALNAMIEEVEAAYEAGNAFRAEIEAMKANLAEAVSIVELDGIYTLLEVYTERVDSIGDLEGDEIGEYTGEMVERAEELLDEVNFELSLTGEVSATEIKTNCNTLFAKIQNIIDNPINYYEFPILLHGSDKVLPGQSGAGAGKSPWPVLEGAYDYNMPAGEDLNGVAHNGYNNLIEYKSPLFRFREPLTSVRFYIRAVGDPGEVDKNGNPHICISGFAMYDENGDIINLTTENVTSNATEREGQGIPGMLDYNPNTFFHSLWKTGTPEPHYIEVTLPEGQYSAFSFKMISYQNTRSRVFPKEMEITYVSPKAAELQQALLAVRKLNPVFGTAPGFFNFDPTYYNAILEEADVVANKKGALDSEIQVSLDKVNSILTKFEEGVTLPEPGKKYRIISGEPRFFTNQNIMKTLTLHTDTIYGNWLWWETAHPDSARQEFILEPCETETDRLYYTFKHAETGLYLSELFDSVGTLIPNRFVFTEQPDSFYIQSLGYGQFGIFASDANSRKQLNMEFHNNGVWSENVQNYGAIAGVKSYIHTWGSSANQSSAWFFREMVTLPQAVKSISELNFRSDALSIYEGVNNLTITADKECAFTDLVVVDVFGNDVAIEELSVEGKVATLKLSKNVETFSVIFTNDEGVAEITIDGFYKYEGVSAAYTALQDKYNEVSAIAPVVGTAVGQVKDVTEYNTAIENALAFLENGAEDAELEAATAALEAAKAGLEFNLPQEDVEYLMLIGLDAIKTNHLTDMAIFADAAQSAPRWTYVSLTNNDFRWKFVDCGELKNGRKAYYIENVGTGLYTATTAENSAMALVEDTTETRPFDIHFMSNGKVAMGDSYWDNGQQCFHPMNHGSGAAANKGGYMISYHKGDPASVMYIVEADKYINDVLLTLDIEDVEIADKNVSPAVKGIFDLFGRRIEKPATTGIYIVDGKKVVIMK